MRDHEGDIRGFYHLSEAWYGPPQLQGSEYTDEVNFGLFAPEGGTSGEMTMKWQEIGGKSVPQLQCFDDGWSALASFPDLISIMGELDDEHITPQQFCELLLTLGFKDLTARVNPYTPTKPQLTREQELEGALKSITSLWPDPGMCAAITDKWIGPNDGKMRADKLFYALNTARKALGLTEYPRPAHWDTEE